jgi:hypothetical protein
MQMQVSIVYLKAFLAKVDGTTWWDGTAVYYAVTAGAFRRRRLPTWLPSRLASRLATEGTLVLELALATLVWAKPLRYAVLAAGVAWHLALEVFLNLQLFGATMIVSLVLFVEPQALDALLQRLGVP